MSSDPTIPLYRQVRSICHSPRSLVERTSTAIYAVVTSNTLQRHPAIGPRPGARPRFVAIRRTETRQVVHRLRFRRLDDMADIL